MTDTRITLPPLTEEQFYAHGFEGTGPTRFVSDEDGDDVLVWGHVNLDDLAETVNAEWLTPADAVTADDFEHRWAVQVGCDHEPDDGCDCADYGWHIAWSVDDQPVTAETPNAFPVTLGSW